MNRGACNICGSEHLSTLLDLGKHPLADTFLKQERFEAEEVHYPLVLAECENCGHVFTSFYIPPSKRYTETEYSYDSSNSPVSKAHFREFASDIVSTYRSLFGAREPRLATDIGSNVGTLLGYLKDDFGVKVVGIEPSPNIAAIAQSNGIPTACVLFDKGVLELDEFAGKTLDVIASTNVVNHMDDLRQMMEVIDAVSSENAMFAFEVPYLVDLLEEGAFDTVYHEHVNYFSAKAIGRLLDGGGFRAVRMQKISYMGGSVRVYAVRKMSPAGRGQADIETFLETEQAFFQANPAWRDDFRKRVFHIKRRLLAFVQAELKKGAKICCIGAATKGNTLLNYCKLDRDSIGLCCDVSKLKVGKKMPGSAIPIVHDNDIGPGWDFGIVLPWNLSDFLIDKFRRSGISLVFPIQGRLITKEGNIENLD